MLLWIMTAAENKWEKNLITKKQALYFRDQVLVGEITESDHKKYFQILKLVKNSGAKLL